ncbi:hypothetical protein LMG29542_08670 [Paraburkholderia humisilvae]|uniref:Transposase InsH N-terminal domain-containing protein n=1 Tax=Paraburkholderia humisilvae TaxID=627669 RepID=A0A6J5F8S4_9BURK|nr:hypothetical protein LMG29542_08670 [Paraburkholderia humisilvae]
MFKGSIAWRNERMKHADLPLELGNRRTRKLALLDEMERVVPCKDFVVLITPHASRKTKGRKPFSTMAMLRIHLLQQWFGLSDVAMEEALCDVPLCREFAGLGGMSRLPERASILRFRHFLEQHRLAGQILQTVMPNWARKVICSRKVRPSM